MGCLTAKASGSIASFISPTVTPIESAKVYFSPTQLGEGTPSPENVREIVGRTSVELKQCGKNLFDKDSVINGKFIGNKGSEGSSQVWCYQFVYVRGLSKITISGSTANSAARFGFYDVDKKWVSGTATKGNKTLTVPSDVYYVSISAIKDRTLSDADIDTLQVEAGSKATPYEPYQDTTIPFSWKRLPDEYQEVEYIESDGGQYIDLPFGFDDTDEIVINMSIDKSSARDSYIVAPISWNTNNNRFGIGTYVYYTFAFGAVATNNTQLIPNTTNDGLLHTWTYKNRYVSMDNGCSFDCASITFGGTTANLRLFYGYNSNTLGKIAYYKHKKANDNEYEFIPCYRKSDNEIGMYDTVSQTFYTNQGTGTFTKGDDVFSDEVYGGYVDLVKGEIVQESDIYIFDGTEDIQGGSGKAWANSESQFYIVERTYQTGIPFVSDSDGSHTFCNLLKPIGTSLFKTGNVICSYGTDSSNGYTFKYIVWESPIFGTTVDECKAKLAELYANGTPLIFVGKIAQSFKKTYQLTSMQLQTLKNENTFWSDADSVEIDYGLAETFDIQKAKRKIIMNQPHVETITGDAVSFTTDMKAPLKECKVSFMPVQEGSGDPSPSNVRNISGWDGVSVKQCKKNFIIEDDPLNPNANYGHNSTGVTKYSEEEQGFYDEPPGISYTAHATGKNGLSYDKVRLFIAPSDMTVVFSIEYKNVGTTYGIRLHKSSSRLTDIHGNADSTWHRYSQVISLSKGDYLKLLIYDKIYWRNIQVEIANSVTDYESYQGTTYSIDWTDDAGTVYGGYVDLVKGELVATHLAFVMDGTNYTVSTGGAINTTTNMARAYSYIGEGGIQNLPNGKSNTGIYASNKYVIHGLDSGTSDSVTDEGVYCGTGKPYVRVVVNADNLSDVSSASAIVNSINEWLQSNPVQICYQLETPITYQLTPQQLITLKGQNNLWADTNGTTEIKFWKH